MFRDDSEPLSWLTDAASAADVHHVMFSPTESGQVLRAAFIPLVKPSPCFEIACSSPPY